MDTKNDLEIKIERLERALKVCKRQRDWFYAFSDLASKEKYQQLEDEIGKYLNGELGELRGWVKQIKRR